MEFKRIILLILLPIIPLTKCDKHVGPGELDATDEPPTTISYSAVYFMSYNSNSESTKNGFNKSGHHSHQVGSYDIDIEDNLDSETRPTDFPDFVSDEAGDEGNSSNGTSSSSTEAVPVSPHLKDQESKTISHKDGNGKSLSLITIRSKPVVRLSELVRPSPTSTDHFYLAKLDVLKSQWVVNDVHGNIGAAEGGADGASGEGANGDIFTVGQDIRNSSLVFLECFANYPVHWTHDSLKVTPYSSKWDQLDLEDSSGHNFTNETSILEIANQLGVNGATFNGGKNYTVTLLIGRGISSRFLQEKDSGNYSCVADANDGTTVSTSAYIYVSDEHRVSPCIQSPCGLNAVCEVRHGNRSCSCLPGFQGNAYVKCREECNLNSDCMETEACVNSRCRDICIGACGKNSYCQIQDQLPMCYCIQGYEGGAYSDCKRTKSHNSTTITTVTINEGANNNDGNETKLEAHGRNGAKSNETHSTTDLCSYCGLNANCVSTENQTLVCKCQRNFVGNPYDKCENGNDEASSNNGTIVAPCQPSPCGENTHCEEKYHRAICHCNANHFGDPWTKCYPECQRRQDCPDSQTCVQMRCQDACLEACGARATCHVQNHIASCSCPENLTGDPFTQCDDITSNNSTTVVTIIKNETNNTMTNTTTTTIEPSLD